MLQNPVLPHIILRVTGNANSSIEPLHNLLRTLPTSRKHDWASCLPQVLFCYNTTPHQGTGESAFYLMFGQEPQLPVDFLLGRVQEPVPGGVQDWVVEHQARLRIAFEGARERLLAAAGRRKERHDQRVREAHLPVGQVVYLRDHGVRGRHKIQDLWSSVVHQVVKAPSVAPVNDPQRVRNVHRDMLKAVVRPETAASPPRPPSPPVLTALTDDPSTDSDLWLVVPDNHSSLPVVTPGASCPSVATPLQVRPIQEMPYPAGCFLPGLSASPTEQPSTSHQALRQTIRPTAGHHSNVHHLPQSTGPQDNAACPDPVSNSQFYVFRPWP